MMGKMEQLGRYGSILQMRQHRQGWWIMSEQECRICGYPFFGYEYYTCPGCGTLTELGEQDERDLEQDSRDLRDEELATKEVKDAIQNT